MMPVSAQEPHEGFVTPQRTQILEPMSVDRIEPLKELEKRYGGSKCADEINNYDWNKDVAYSVMMVESSGNPRNLNDNPRTGDYSVGCFQVNLLGGNLKSKYGIAVSLGYTGALDRDSLREWLWEANNNVAVAHALWKGSGWKPWQATTCKKVACY